MGYIINNLHSIFMLMQNGGNMFQLVRTELNDQGQQQTFVLRQAENKDDLRKEWENIIDKTNLEIIEL